jgi:hypothetical protein
MAVTVGCRRSADKSVSTRIEFDMIKRVVSWALIFRTGMASYHGRFAITHPFGYITSKIGFPFFLMIFSFSWASSWDSMTRYIS